MDCQRGLQPHHRRLRQDATARSQVVRGGAGLRAAAYLHKGDREQAIADCDACLGISEKDDAALLVRAATPAFQEKNYDKALADCNRCIELGPRTAYAFDLRAAIHVALDHSDEALADLDELLKLKPEYGDAYKAQAWLYLDRRDNAKAKADFEAAHRYTSPEKRAEEAARAKKAERVAPALN